jgi:leader peptidase (prepilin peptidase)/N-methyltransferase
MRISPRYPLVELLAAALATALYHRYGVSWTFLAYFLFAAGLVVATFVDLEHMIIPNEVTYLLLPVGLGVAFAEGVTVPPLDAALGAAAGAGSLLVVAATYRLLRGVRGLGMGDVKLFAAIGAFLGWRALPLVIFLAAAQGLLVAGVILLGRRGKAARPAEPVPPPPATPAPAPPAEEDDGPPPGRLAVPFGPFLALGALEALFFGGAIQRAVFGFG